MRNGESGESVVINGSLGASARESVTRFCEALNAVCVRYMRGRFHEDGKLRDGHSGLDSVAIRLRDVDGWMLKVYRMYVAPGGVDIGEVYSNVEGISDALHSLADALSAWRG